MKELLAKGEIERIGEYNSSNPLYRGLKAKSKKEKEEAEAAKKKGGKQ